MHPATLTRCDRDHHEDATLCKEHKGELLCSDCYARAAFDALCEAVAELDAPGLEAEWSIADEALSAIEARLGERLHARWAQERLAAAKALRGAA
jgi:hypothetical protein